MKAVNTLKLGIDTSKLKHYDEATSRLHNEPVILPISMREKGMTYKPPKNNSPMIASDGVREFYADGTREIVFPYELHSHLRKKYGG